MNHKKIAIIGGGTGSSVVLSGLKNFTQSFDLTAIVVVSDSGGSTGRLRDEFGFLPVGDMRQCLAALTEGKRRKDIRQLLLYRFSKGKGLKGHNLGNLILTALEDICGSPALAVQKAAEIYKVGGKVFPITETVVDLILEYKDGTVKIGEHLLDDEKNGGKKISKIKLSPKASIYPQAAQAISEADLVVMGPGDLYASLLPNACVHGFTKAMQVNKKNNGQFVYIVNLMTHYSQTHNMTAQDHVDEITRYCGRKPDHIVMHDGQIEASILMRYKDKNEFPVEDDLAHNSNVIRSNLVNNVEIETHQADSCPRSLLRHDGMKLAQLLSNIINKN